MSPQPGGAQEGARRPAGPVVGGGRGGGGAGEDGRGGGGGVDARGGVGGGGDGGGGAGGGGGTGWRTEIRTVDGRVSDAVRRRRGLAGGRRAATPRCRTSMPRRPCRCRITGWRGRSRCRWRTLRRGGG